MLHKCAHKRLLLTRLILRRESRERERETETETDRDRDRQRQTETDRERDRERQRDRQEDNFITQLSQHWDCRQWSSLTNCPLLCCINVLTHDCN